MMRRFVILCIIFAIGAMKEVAEEEPDEEVYYTNPPPGEQPKYTTTFERNEKGNLVATTTERNPLVNPKSNVTAVIHPDSELSSMAMERLIDGKYYEELTDE